MHARGRTWRTLPHPTDRPPAFMDTSQLAIELLRAYPRLGGLPGFAPPAGLPAGCEPVTVAAGTVLFDEGVPCGGFPLLLEGTVGVARHTPSGRALELYRVLRGEICVISAGALLRSSEMTARGTALEYSRLVMVSPTTFARWNDHAPFRNFVFGLFAQRLTDLMVLVDAVAFQRLDRRLADHLLGHGDVLRTTHQSLADELGTVREMITRLLRRFEEAGLVRLSRERIVVLDAVGLREVAAGHGPGPRSPDPPV